MTFDRPTASPSPSVSVTPRPTIGSAWILPATIPALGAWLLAAGCSGGGGSSGTLYIETCSLGCGGGASGNQVTCSYSDISVNGDIAVYFSAPIDPSSVSSATFRVVDEATGAVPLGVRFVDPSNNRKVVFRPNVSFDQQSQPVYGLTAGRTYTITIGGGNQGDEGPFIRSAQGANNATRLRCTVQATLGVVDLVPGSPDFTAVVDVRDDDGNLVPNVPALGATGVATESSVVLTFNELMNPASLTNFIRASVDTDGDLDTSFDRVPLSGTFDVDLNTSSLTTTAIFTPSSGMPSAGSNPNPALRRKVLVDVPANCIDLANNPLASPQTIFFTPEAILFDPVVLPDADGEQFSSQTLHDALRSSAEWGNGKLTRGIGGGSGRHGDLQVGAGDALALNTDTETFPRGWLTANGQPYDVIARLPANFSPTDKSTWPTATVTRGAFEFSRFIVQSNGSIRFTGDEPARVFSRGPAEISGTVDVRGATPAEHAGDWGQVAGQTYPVEGVGNVRGAGGPGGAGGPAAGAGGRGASRNDTARFAPGLITPSVQPTGIDVTPDAGFNSNGEPGQGIGGVGTGGAGRGGTNFPLAFPEANVTEGAQAGTVIFSDLDCFVRQVASPGGGGGYALDGGNAQPATDGASPVTELPTTIATGGPFSESGLEAVGAPAVRRKLDYDAGHLLGGAGGGGGGLDMYGSSTVSFAPFCTGPGTGYQGFTDNSGCGGGGGGGALQIVSGGRLLVNGVIDVRGGNGGSASTDPTDNNRKRNAPPGGGGSGGAVRLQARDIDLQQPTSTSTLIDVRGGTGGTNRMNSRGGTGGAGVVRLEDLAGLVTLDEAAKLAPNDASAFQTVGGNLTSKLLTVGNWATPRRQPVSYTAGMSCWMKPSGNFFEATFAADEGSIASADDYGWNMNVIYDDNGVEREFSYRGRFDGNGAPTATYPVAGTADFQEALGNNLNFDLGAGEAESYIAVRFQGAVVTGSLIDPCSVSLGGPSATIVPGSETAWVKHPEELNSFVPRPNMVRFVVIFDTKQAVNPAGLPAKVRGVTDLRIKAQPD